jgi:hypothetical protein
MITQNPSRRHVVTRHDSEPVNYQKSVTRHSSPVTNKNNNFRQKPLIFSNFTPLKKS